MINTTHLKLRRNLGILGISLPAVLFIGNNLTIEPSISHYYYTHMIVIFTGVLAAFGLFLFSYRGYEKEVDEVISDNWLTNFAGFLAILTAVIPTACDFENCLMPHGHSDSFFGTVHLMCAAGFLAIMGWMAYFRFTRGDTSDPLKRRRNAIYRCCGIGVWVALIILGSQLIFDWHVTRYDVFLGETIALIFFGSAWLIKGKTLQAIGL